MPKPYTAGIWAYWKQANLDNDHPNGCYCQDCYVVVKKKQAEAAKKRKEANA